MASAAAVTQIDTHLPTDSGQKVAAVGFSQNVLQKLETSAKASGADIVRLSTPRELFRVWEESPNIICVVMEASESAEEPRRVAEILRANGLEVPIVATAPSALEAGWLQRQVPSICVVGGKDVSSVLGSVVAASVARVGGLPEENGTMTQRQLLTFFGRAAIAGATGCLRLEREGAWKEIFFRNGRPVYAASDLLSENFGRFLLMRGVITDVEYNWARRLQKQEGVRQGEALVKIGVLSRQGLYRSLQQQIRFKLVNAFVRGDASYSWRAGGERPTNEFSYNEFRLLTDGVSRHQNEDVVRERWDHLRDKRLAVVDHTHPLWESAAEYLGRGFVNGINNGDTVESLFASGTAFSDRIAALEVLEDALMARPSFTATGATIEVSHPEPSAETTSSDILIATCLNLRVRNFYELLGVHPASDEAAIEQAYVEACARFSSDRFEDVDTVRRKLDVINQRLDEAWEVLSDPGQRRAYDESLEQNEERRSEKRELQLSAEDAYDLGLQKLDDGDFDAALRAFERASKMRPEEPLYRLYQGWARVQAAETHSRAWSQGRRELVDALGASPSLAQGYYFLARISIAQNDRAEAMENLRMALKLDPELHEARSLQEELSNSSNTGH